MIGRTVATRLMARKSGPRLHILVYHKVHSKVDPLDPDGLDISAFAMQMRTISRYFRVYPLTQAVRMLNDGSLPSRAVCVTFDDGYADNVINGLPILKRYGICATFFITTGFIGGGLMWNDKVIETIRRVSADTIDLTPIKLDVYEIKTKSQKVNAIKKMISQIKYLPVSEREEVVAAITELAEESLPSNLMMTSRQLGTLVSSGMAIGAHTVHHPILTKITNQGARKEIGESRESLESITGERVRMFAYPNGYPGQDYDAEHVRMVQAMGFDGAVSTACGGATQETDVYQLPRCMPWGRWQWHVAMRILHNGSREPAYISANDRPRERD